MTARPLAEVAHGVDTVALTVNGPHPGTAVLTPNQAETLGRRLIDQAEHARHAAVADFAGRGVIAEVCCCCGRVAVMSELGLCEPCTEAVPG